MSETVRAERYTWWRVLRGSSLTPTARHVAFTLSSYMNKDGGGAWPSLATLAGDTGRSRRTVARAISELSEAGYLQVESGGGRRGDGGYVSNRYVARAPVSSVMGDMDTAWSGDTDDTDRDGTDASALPPQDPGAVTSQQGTVSSQQGTVSPVTGSGDTHGTRSTHELASQEPKQHAAKISPAPDGASKKASDKFEQGCKYRDHVTDGKLTEDDVRQLSKRMTDEDRRAFLKGYVEGPTEAVAS